MFFCLIHIFNTTFMNEFWYLLQKDPCFRESIVGCIFYIADDILRTIALLSVPLFHGLSELIMHHTIHVHYHEEL